MKINKNHFFQITQKIGDFYVCKMTPRDLKSIAKADIDRYKNMDEIQRELKIERTKQIKNYIYGKDYATFPNSFIISVNNESFIDDSGNLNLEGEAYILDGQHRLSGFNIDEEDFEIIVSVFIGLDKFHQAMIFANINGEQMKVNKSLIYSLYGFGEERTTELITYSLISLLNKSESSSWNGLIKLLGKGEGVLSLAPFFEVLKKEMDDGVFKSYYQSDGKKFDGLISSDEKLYFVLEDYYNAIKELFPEEWGNKDYILTKTTGFYAFFRLLVYIFSNKKYNNYSHFTQPTINSFKEIINKSKDNLNGKLDSNTYESGVRGQNKLYNELIEKLEF